MKKAKPLTTSWTIPKPGDVLNYAFLWNHEAQQGLTEGLKERPCVVVLSVSQQAYGLSVVVCPITSKTPENAAGAIEILPRIKNHLGLMDREKSYAITSEVNHFVWPGPDLRPFEKKGAKTIYHGSIPGQLLILIRDEVLAHGKRKKLKTTPR